MASKYIRSDWVNTNVFGPLIMALIRIGLSPRGAHILAVRGRRSGVVRQTPVNPLLFEGKRYLVAPRGDTQWVRNLRTVGEAELRVGKRREMISGREIGNVDKVSVLRAYLQKWGAETAKFFGVAKFASDADLARIAPDHPVFEVTRSSR